MPLLLLKIFGSTGKTRKIITNSCKDETEFDIIITKFSLIGL